MVDEQIASGSLDDDKTETMGSRWLMNMYLLYVESMKQFYLKKKLDAVFHGPLLDVPQPGGKKTLT
jgi:hypothetical protein